MKVLNVMFDMARGFLGAELPPCAGKTAFFPPEQENMNKLIVVGTAVLIGVACGVALTIWALIPDQKE